MDTKSQTSLDRMAREIRTIYRRDPASAPFGIEEFLSSALGSMDSARRLEILSRLKSSFTDRASETPRQGQVDEQTLLTLLGRLLKHGSVRSDLSADQMLDKITAAMTVIFETLNQLIAVIQATLFGKSPDLETIRYVIGSTLEGEGGARSIEDFLDQIREAFLISHRAFQLAAEEKLHEVLQELEPSALLSRGTTGLRRGPFGKAEAFEIFREKHEIIGQWLTSERFQHDLLRAFEAQCMRLYSKREESQ